MAILFKLIIIAVFTTIFLPGCRILSPHDQPFLAGEALPQAEIAETTATPELAPPVTTAPGASAAEKTKKKSVTPSVERSVKLRLTYTVGEGELLWSIAKRPDIYGDPLLWPLLYQANRDQIKDPRKIYAGQTLTIPRTISEEEREKARNLAKKSDIFSPE
jgi:nucleoid-associated protein YgaU